MGLAVLAVLALVTGLMVRILYLGGASRIANMAQLTIAWFAGARFDIMFDQIFKKGMFLPPKNAEQTAAVKQAYEHGEL
jgi:hypothetical protein